MDKGKIVILNGASSAGKTSLAKAMQKQFADTFLLMGIDMFWMTMPERQLDLTTVAANFYTWVEEEIDDKPFLRILPGPVLDQIMFARYGAIAVYLNAGFNVIADDVTWSRLWLVEGLKILAPFETYFVGVYADDRVLSHREILRGDRLTGWARGSQKWVHEHLTYDIILDSSVIGSQELALKVVAAVEGNFVPEAAATMRQLFEITI